MNRHRFNSRRVCFCPYLSRQKGYEPANLDKTKLPELRNEFKEWIKTAQNWLSANYPSKQIKEINIDSRANLQGSLTISDYPNLEEISIRGDLTQFQTNNCPNLKKFHLDYNQISNLNLTNNEKLKELWISNNKLTNQDIGFSSRHRLIFL